MRSNERTAGQGLLEFALVVPVMMMLFFGIFDLGRAVYAYSTIANAARQADRIAIVNQDLASIQAKAVLESAGLGISDSAVLVTYCKSGQLCESDASVACSPPVAIGCDAVVTVPYTFAPVTPVISSAVGTITMSSTSRIAVERTYGSGGTNP